LCIETERGNHTQRNILLKQLLYENIDQILPNRLHGPTHYTDR